MPEDDFKDAVDAVLRVVIFENWLRFYFIKEDGEELKIELPEKALKKIAELYPFYLPLAEGLNKRPLDFAASRDAILMFALDYLDGRELPRGDVEKVFSSREFQSRLRLFHAWTQLCEEQLDQGFLDFGAWLKLFREWESGPGGRELAGKLSEKGGAD